MAKGQKAAANFVAEMNARAERLAEVRGKLREREEQYKADTDAWFAEERQLKEQLLADLKTIGLKSIKTTSGESYVISTTHAYEARNPLELERWATEQRLVRVDRELIKSKLRTLDRAGQLPEFITVIDKETISIRKPKAEGEAEPAAAEDASA